MLKVGLVGIGGMGHGHLEMYLRLMADGVPVELVSLCDVNPRKFEDQFTGGNLGELGRGRYQMDRFHLYTDFDEMLRNEELDYIDITLPTYLHSYYAVKALNAGKHVLCEKPMALNPTQCRLMIDAAEKNGKKLMIAQCLRFYPSYEILKRIVDSGEFGKPVFCYFYRGGGTPRWAFQDWFLDENRSGGCLMDQHIHDVDMIQWLFGMPEAVSSLGRNVIPGAGFDAVNTQYRYDGFIVNSADDWTLNSKDSSFQAVYRANFEKGFVVLEKDVCTVYPQDGPSYVVEDVEDGYYREIKYFVEAILNDTPIEVAAPESTYQTICLATAERESARRNGEWTKVTL